MTDRGSRATTGGVGLLLVLAATATTLAAGALVKTPCAAGDWSDGRQYRRLCYSDIVPLYGTEHLQGGRIPFLDACPGDDEFRCDEYPVLTMLFMRVAAWPVDGYGGFFWLNAVLLGLLALATAWMLYLMAGERAMYFAIAPTLLAYAFVNWDLLAVALATAGSLFYFTDRDEVSGAFFGLGAAAKLYPALLLVPFVFDRIRHRRTGGAVSLVVWSAIAYAVVNVPFALVARDGWLTFFRFNSQRAADFDSLWYIACDRLHIGCSLSHRAINLFSVVGMALLAAAMWFLRRRRRPDFHRWTLVFPFLVIFLLVNKVYSPQYGLWLLPLFVLALPSLPLFVAFEASDLAVFITRFSWFGRLSGLGGAPLGAFQIAVLLRAVVLVACLVAWVRRGQDEALALPSARSTAEPALEPGLATS